MPLYHAVSIGQAGYEFEAPSISPVDAGCALVAIAGSGGKYQMGWTDRPVLTEPVVDAENDEDYLSADGTWREIPMLSYGTIVGALGYTPVNKAGDTMAGRLNISDLGAAADGHSRFYPEPFGTSYYGAGNAIHVFRHAGTNALGTVQAGTFEFSNLRVKGNDDNAGLVISVVPQTGLGAIVLNPGPYTRAHGNGSVAIGSDAFSTGINAVTIGQSLSDSVNGKLLIGAGGSAFIDMVAGDGKINTGTLGIYQSNGSSLGTMQTAFVENPSGILNLGNATYGVSVAGASIITANSGYPNLTLVNAGEAELRLDASLAGAHVWGIKHSSGSLYFQHATSRPFGGTITSPLVIGPTGEVTVKDSLILSSDGNGAAILAGSPGNLSIKDAAGQYSLYKSNGSTLHLGGTGAANGLVQIATSGVLSTASHIISGATVFGTRVLAGAGVADDGSTALQVLGGAKLSGNILGPSNFQIRAQTYLDLNIDGTTLLGIGSSTLDVAGTLRPTVDLGRDLGSTARRFQKVYAASVGDPTSGRSLILDGGYGSMLIDYYASRSRWMGKNAEPISIQSNAASGIALVQFLNGGTSIPVSIFGDRLLVKGLAGQTSNLQEWQDSTGAVKAFIASDGKSIGCKDSNFGFQLVANPNAFGADGMSVKSFDGTTNVSLTSMGFNGTYNPLLTGSGGLLDTAQTAYRAVLNKNDAGQLQVHSGGGFTWGVSTGNQRVENPDTGIWRLAANSIGFGNGTAGTSTASITAGAATFSGPINGASFGSTTIGGTYGSTLLKGGVSVYNNVGGMSATWFNYNETGQNYIRGSSNAIEGPTTFSNAATFISAITGKTATFTCDDYNANTFLKIKTLTNNPSTSVGAGIEFGSLYGTVASIGFNNSGLFDIYAPLSRMYLYYDVTVVGYPGYGLLVYGDTGVKVRNRDNTANGPITAGAATFNSVQVGVGGLGVPFDIQGGSSATYSAVGLGLNDSTGVIYNLNSTPGTYSQLVLVNRGSAAGFVRLAAVSNGISSSDLVVSGSASAELLRIANSGAATFSGTISSPTGGTLTGERFGAGSVSSDYGLAIGQSSTGTASSVACGYATYTIYESVAVGSSAYGGWRGVAIGRSASTSNHWSYGSVAIGYGATTTHDAVVAMGSNVVSTMANQFVTGAASSPITNFRIHGNSATITFERDGGSVMSWDASLNTTFSGAAKVNKTSFVANSAYVSCQQAGVEEATLQAGIISGYGGTLKLSAAGTDYIHLRANAGYPRMDINGTFGFYANSCSMVMGGTYLSWTHTSNEWIRHDGQLRLRGDLTQSYDALVTAASARFQMAATGKRLSEVGDGASAWQTGYSEEYNAGGIRIGWGVAPIAKQTYTTGDGADSLAALLHNLGLITKV